MALNTDPAVGTWVQVSRFNEALWVQVTSAANGALFANNPTPAPLAWPPLEAGKVYGPISYSEVLQFQGNAPNWSAPDDVVPDVTNGDVVTGASGAIVTTR